MCAECHSTGVRKNYDAANDRFATTFAEISVGCEACHAQGSRHVSWARDQQSWWPFGKQVDPDKGLLVRFDERHGVTWPRRVFRRKRPAIPAPTTTTSAVHVASGMSLSQPHRCCVMSIL